MSPHDRARRAADSHRASAGAAGRCFGAKPRPGRIEPTFSNVNASPLAIAPSTYNERRKTTSPLSASECDHRPVATRSMPICNPAPTARSRRARKRLRRRAAGADGGSSSTIRRAMSGGSTFQRAMPKRVGNALLAHSDGQGMPSDARSSRRIAPWRSSRQGQRPTPPSRSLRDCAADPRLCP